MAGFFGLFDYQKEGPGVEKDAPKKKAFIVFFEIYLKNFWKFLTVNIACIVMSCLLIPSGLAQAGITNIARNTARDKHSFGIADYFSTIAKNWKQALLAGLINLGIGGVLGWSMLFYLDLEPNLIALFGIGVLLFIIIAFLIMNFYIWSLIITFDLPLKKIYKNSFKFVFINLKNNVLCGLILLLCYAAYFAFFMAFPLALPFEIIIFAITFPSFRALLIQFFTFPSIKKYMIDPYYEQHPDEDIEKRRNLGLEVEESTQNNESEGD